ncbi:MAG: CoA transferase, partial [Burkholderiales bacterium]
PCGPLQTTDEVVTHPQTEAVEMLQSTPDGKMRFVGVPIRFDGERPGIRRGPPTLGEHTDEILR